MFYLEKNNDIEYYKSDILGDEIIHAFTTRKGSDTPFPLDSFSMGTAGKQEFKSYIEKNRQKICQILNLDYKKIINPEQKHTDNIKIINDANIDLTNTDGVITNTPGLVLMLLFADCIPIILYNSDKKVLGVIHAGWRGTAKQIAIKAVNIFKETYGILPDRINAVVGAGIGQCCYPVSPEVAIELRKTIKENHSNIFIEENLIRVDLKMLNKQQLLEAGVNNIDVLNECTSCNNKLFYSYRADKGETGRHAAIASIKEE